MARSRNRRRKVLVDRELRFGVSAAIALLVACCFTFLALHVDLRVLRDRLEGRSVKRDAFRTP